MKKKIVLNACGVKSLGGVKLFVEAFEYFSTLNEDIIVLYSENEFFGDLKNQTYENSNVKFIQLTKKRYLHPYLNFLIGKKLMEEINSSSAIIHFGNFGFDTQVKSFIFIQNILPFISRNLKNRLLLFFINRSFEKAEHIVVQLSHTRGLINDKYKKKILQIGEIKQTKVKAIQKNNNIVCFGSNIPNKNFKFMLDVLTSLPNKQKVTIINPPTKLNEFNCVFTETHEQTLSVLSLNEIYFHASEFETVGLPLYEAQELGLKVVAPIKPYSQNFLTNNVYLYHYKNIDDALNKINEAGISENDYLLANSYTENWKQVLDKI